MSPSLLLSAVEIAFTSPDFAGAIRSYGSDDAFRALRASNDLLVYRIRGRSGDSQVLVVPKTDSPADDGLPFGPLPVRENLRALGHFIEDGLVELLPKLAGR